MVRRHGAGSASRECRDRSATVPGVRGARPASRCHRRSRALSRFVGGFWEGSNRFTLGVMLVGRESEIATIERVLAEARAGRSGALVVAGEAGVGKTALLDNAVARAEEFVVLLTRGVEAEAEVPFAALIELLGPVASQINALPEPQATALQAVFALAGPRQVEATTPAAATLALVSAVSQDAPLLALVDDA